MKQYKITKKVTKMLIALAAVSLVITFYSLTFTLKADTNLPGKNEGVGLVVVENSTKSGVVCINKPFTLGAFFEPNSTLKTANGKISVCNSNGQCFVKSQFSLDSNQIDKTSVTITSIGEKKASSEYSATDVEGTKFEKLKSETLNFQASECDEKGNPISNNSNEDKQDTSDNKTQIKEEIPSKTEDLNSSQIEPSNITKVGDLVQRFLNFLFYTVASISFINLLIAGIKFITSSGEADKMAKAKKDIIYNIIGVLIAVLSLVFVKMIFNIANGLTA